MYKKLILAFSLLGILTLQNCKEKEPEEVPPVVTAPEVTFPAELKNVDGVFAAITTLTKSNAVEIKVGIAYGVFYSGKNPAKKLDAGTVKINSKVTTKTDDNIYFYGASAAEPNGLVYQSQSYWEATGNAANSIDAFSNKDGSGFPNFPAMPEYIKMNSLQDKLIDWTSSFGADSVILFIKGASSNYKRVFNNTVTKHTLTAAEIGKLGVGAGTMTITNYKLENRTVGTKTYAFLKQSIATCSKLEVTQ